MIMAKEGDRAQITAKTFLIVFWRVLVAYGFYPLMFGLMIWVIMTDKSWIWGAAILAAIFIFDPIWRILFGRIKALALRGRR